MSKGQSKRTSGTGKPAQLWELLVAKNFAEVVAVVTNRKNFGFRYTIDLQDVLNILQASEGCTKRWAVALALLHCARDSSSAMQPVIDVATTGISHPHFVTIVLKLDLHILPIMAPILIRLEGAQRQQLWDGGFVVMQDQVKQLLVDLKHPYPQTHSQVLSILSAGLVGVPLVQANPDLFQRTKNVFCIMQLSVLVAAGVMELPQALELIKQKEYNNDIWGSQWNKQDAFSQVFMPHCPYIVGKLSSGIGMPWSHHFSNIAFSISSGNNLDHMKELIWWHNNVHKVRSVEDASRPQFVEQLIKEATTAEKIIQLLSQMRVVPDYDVVLPEDKQALLVAYPQLKEKLQELCEKKSQAFLTLVWYLPRPLVRTIANDQQVNVSLRMMLHWSAVLLYNLQIHPPSFHLSFRQQVTTVLRTLKQMVEGSGWAQKLFWKHSSCQKILYAILSNGYRFSFTIVFASYKICSLMRAVPVGASPPAIVYANLCNYLSLRWANDEAVITQVNAALANVTEEQKQQLHPILVNFFSELKQRRTSRQTMEGIFQKLPDTWKEFVVDGIAPLQMSYLTPIRNTLLFLNQEAESTKLVAEIKERWEKEKEGVPRNQLAGKKRKFTEDLVEKREAIVCNHCKTTVSCKYAKYTVDCELQQFFCARCVCDKKVPFGPLFNVLPN